MEAFKYFELSAKQGNSEGQYYLGIMYRKGKGVKTDDSEARKNFELSAAQGNPQAQFSLGESYLYGLGVELDPKEAAEHFILSAKQGKGESALEEITKQLLTLAEAGNSCAQATLKHMDEVGAVPEGYREKIKSFPPKSDADLITDHQLAKVHYDHGISHRYGGHNLERSRQKEIQSLEESAKRGYLKAHFALGDIYMEGYDYVKAAGYYITCVKCGYEDVKPRFIGLVPPLLQIANRENVNAKEALRTLNDLKQIPEKDQAEVQELLDTAQGKSI
jgi:hypothetical protein